MNSNQTFCEDIDEVGDSFQLVIWNKVKIRPNTILWTTTKTSQCALYNPCDGMVKCINLAPGFRCEPCPNGYDGMHATGYFAESIGEDYINQLCTGKFF